MIVDISKKVVNNNKIGKFFKESYDKHYNKKKYISNEYDDDDNNSIFAIMFIVVILYVLAIYYLVKEWKKLDDWCKILAVTLLVTGELGGPITTLILIYLSLMNKN